MPSSEIPSSQPTSFAAVILAAGKSTRMKSKTPKALHPILGKPLLRFATEAVRDAGATRTIIVVGHQADAVAAAMGSDYEYCTQSEQKGTGHAVMMAEELLADWGGAVLVLPGDAPLLTSECLRDLISKHQTTRAAATLLTATLPDAGAYGRVVRDIESGQVRSIVEAKDATDDQLKITEIGTSVYLFDKQILFATLKQISPNNAQSEYYLTDVISLMCSQGHIVEAFVTADSDVVRGVNTREELVGLGDILRRKVLNHHMANGVTIVDPSSTHIDIDVKIGQDTVVLPYTMINGVTDIGEDCLIGPGARISDSVLGSGVSVKDSYVVASEVGDATRIGPFANLRPGNIIGKNVKIGDFVELKQTVLGDGVSAGHLAYLGDATVGEHTNIGAGVITCNFDGVTKHKTTIGSNAFVGTNTTLVAPISLGDDAFTAAGSTLTEDVPDGAFAIARERQSLKEGWVARSYLVRGAQDQT